MHIATRKKNHWHSSLIYCQFLFVEFNYDDSVILYGQYEDNLLFSSFKEFYIRWKNYPNEEVQFSFSDEGFALVYVTDGTSGIGILFDIHDGYSYHDGVVLRKLRSFVFEENKRLTYDSFGRVLLEILDRIYGEVYTTLTDENREHVMGRLERELETTRGVANISTPFEIRGVSDKAQINDDGSITVTIKSGKWKMTSIDKPAPREDKAPPTNFDLYT